MIPSSPEILLIFFFLVLKHQIDVDFVSGFCRYRESGGITSIYNESDHCILLPTWTSRVGVSGQ